MYRVITVQECEKHFIKKEILPKDVINNFNKGIVISNGYYCLAANPSVMISSFYVANSDFVKSNKTYIAFTEEELYKHKKATPSNGLKELLGKYIDHASIDINGNHWYWDEKNNKANYLIKDLIWVYTGVYTGAQDATALYNTSFKYIDELSHLNNAALNCATTNKNGRVYPENILDKAIESAYEENFFKLSTEEEIKLKLNDNYTNIAKQDIAGYKKGDIINAPLYDQLTGDPIIFDLNTGKKVTLGQDTYESRNNTEYLKMRQDN